MVSAKKMIGHYGKRQLVQAALGPIRKVAVCAWLFLAFCVLLKVCGVEALIPQEDGELVSIWDVIPVMQTLFWISLVVIITHITVVMLSFDLEAEQLVDQRVEAFNTKMGPEREFRVAELAENPHNFRTGRFTTEVTAEVKCRLGLDACVNALPADRKAAHREAWAYVRDQTREGAPREGMRKEHILAHVTYATDAVFILSDIELEVAGARRTHVYRARTNQATGNLPSFQDFLLGLLHSLLATTARRPN